MCYILDYTKSSVETRAFYTIASAFDEAESLVKKSRYCVVDVYEGEEKEYENPLDVLFDCQLVAIYFGLERWKRICIR